PAAVVAQEVTLARFLSNSLASAASIARPLSGSVATAQGDTAGHFYNQALRQGAPAELDTSLSAQVTTFPTAFAWGAPAPATGGRPEFGTRGSGSSWVELPTTLGRGRATFTVGHEALEFGSLDSADLRGANLALWTAHDDCCAPIGSSLNPAFERDLLEQRFVVDVDRHTYAFFGAIGVTDRLDVGIMVPIVTVRLDARITSRIIRTSTADTYVYGFQSPGGAAVPVPHAYDAIEIANRTTYHRGEQRGLGDVLVKAKYRVAGASDGIAISLGATLPSGDADRLLGAGSFRGDATLLMSRTMGRFNPHVNVGYTLATGSGGDSLDGPIAAGAPTPSTREVPDVLHVAAGVDWALHRRVHVSLNALGRRLSGLPRFSTQQVTFPLRGPGVTPPTYVASDHLTADSTGTAFVQTLAVASTRVFIASHLLCTVELLFPINEQGLQTRVGAAAGLSWGF
ncbi:MAG: hypothetical protein Q7V01_16260, partial [Vicinamibacterales bacterium]|nr:hypothetical protein [Vicinamibacterales bacterium]